MGDNEEAVRMREFTWLIYNRRTDVLTNPEAAYTEAAYKLTIRAKAVDFDEVVIRFGTLVREAFAVELYAVYSGETAL